MSVRKEMQTVTFSLPSTSGSYSAQRLTFGEVGSGQAKESYQGITVSVDTSVASMTVELWLPSVAADVPFIDGDYTYSGKSIGATGSETWALAGYPGCQIRVKSGGTGGSPVLSASVF